MGVMVLTLMVGWLVVSVLSAVLWSLVVRGSHARESQRNELPNYVPDYVTDAIDLPVSPSPRRS